MEDTSTLVTWRLCTLTATFPFSIEAKILSFPVERCVGPQVQNYTKAESLSQNASSLAIEQGR